MKRAVADLSLFHSVEAFYSGGSVQWNSDGTVIYATCGNIVKAFNCDDSLPRYLLFPICFCLLHFYYLLLNCFCYLLFISFFRLIIGDINEDLRITCTLLNKNDSSMIIAYSNSLLRQYSLSFDKDSNLSAEIKRQWKSTHTLPILVMKNSPNDIYLATGSADFAVKVNIFYFE